jgi:hypothetical protein
MKDYQTGDTIVEYFPDGNFCSSMLIVEKIHDDKFVVMIRGRNNYVSLEMGNLEKVEMFFSVHCGSSKGKTTLNKMYVNE